MLRVLIADDHAIFRRGLAALLNSQPDVAVVGEVGNWREWLDRATALAPDLVLTDLSMPGLGLTDSLRQLRSRGVSSRVLVLTMHADPLVARRTLREDVVGYLLKANAADEILAALRAFRAGQRFVSPEVAEKLAALPHGGSLLSPRERDIVQLIAAGKSNKQIATALGCSLKTVDTHRQRVMKKLDVHSAAELVRYAIEHRLIDAVAQP
jgi:DNA-binding NarL/FixJ family response regulator